MPGLGDLLAALLRQLGVKECAGCRRRKRRANRFGAAAAAWLRWLSAEW